jgi:hypothetical protein
VIVYRINLEVSLQNYQVAKDLVRQYLAAPKPSQKVYTTQPLLKHAGAFRCQAGLVVWRHCV